jgi:hypothetical protein
VFLKHAKSNQPLAVFFLPLACLLIWFNPILPHADLAVDTSLGAMPLYYYIIQIAPVFSDTSRILSCVLVVIIAFMISRLNTKFIFISERTYLPSILYLIIVCAAVPFKEIYPILPALILFLFAFERLLDSYKIESLSYKVFDASFLLGIASLFYFNIIFYLVFIWITISIIRPFHWREWFFSILGLAIPYLILFSTYYLFDISYTPIFESIKSCFKFQLPIFLNKSHYLFLGYISIVILIASQYVSRILSAKKILARKSFNLFLVLFLITLILFIFIKSASIDLVFIAAIPVSIMLAQYFISVRPSRWVETIFDLLIVLLLITQTLKF